MSTGGAWQAIWNRKGLSAQNTACALANLIALDGFDHGLGRMTEATFRAAAERLWNYLTCPLGGKVLEVGCGAGAMLKALEDRATFVGIDYAATLLRFPRRALTGVTVLCAEARALPFAAGVFDATFAHSVFQYFPDLAYAEKVLQDMVLVTSRGGKIVLADVPDQARRREAEMARHAGGSVVTGPTHLYYPRDFFVAFARCSGLQVQFFEQDFAGYGNSPFRFTLLLCR